MKIEILVGRKDCISLAIFSSRDELILISTYTNLSDVFDAITTLVEAIG